MFLEKIVVIFISIILIYFLSKKYVLRYHPENMFIIMFSTFCLALYIGCARYNVYIPIILQFVIFTFSILIPIFFTYVQYNNIIISRKILYYIMKNNYHNKEYDETIKYVKKLIDIEGRKSEYYYILGMCYKFKKDFINSRDSFTLAIELDRRDYKSYYELGLVLNDTNKKDIAIVMLNNSLRLKPDFYEAAEALGICLTSQAKYEDAIQAYNNMLEYYPKAYEVYYNIAMIELELGDYAKAENAFENSIKIAPKLYSAYYNVGKLNYLTGNYDKAIECFKKSTNSITYEPKSYYKLAMVYSAKNEYEKAFACLEYAIQLNSVYLTEAKNELIFSKLADRLNDYELNIEKIKNGSKNIKEEIKYKLKEKIFN